MLRALSRIQAWLLALALLLACLASATLHPSVPEPGATPAGPYSDMQLYHDLADRVAAGENYYAAATDLHRTHAFPTQPFLTVRLPTLDWLEVSLGWSSLKWLLIGLLMLSVVAWYRQLDKAQPAERLGLALLLLAGGAMVTQPLLVAQHELWAGILLTIAMALRGTRHWPLALLAGAAALAIRELALPFALLALAFALLERRKSEALGWAGLIAAFAVALAFHAAAVAAHVLPGDLASQGWSGLRGPQAVLQDLVDVSLLNALPGPLAYPVALLALFGWAGAPVEKARFALLWFAGFALVLALFARTQNFYWAIVLLPAWLAGLAFLPRALGDLSHAMLARAAARG